MISAHFFPRSHSKNRLSRDWVVSSWNVRNEGSYEISVISVIFENVFRNTDMMVIPHNDVAS